MDKDPRSWDGSQFRNSGFLYPPLCAQLFVAFSHLSYLNAKLIWTLAIFLSLILILMMLIPLFWPEGSSERYLLCLGIAFWFFPTLLLLHNGNVDSLNLLLITFGFCLADRWKTSWSYFTFGILIAVACLLKLDCVLLLPGVFGLRWRPLLLGFFLATAALISISLGINGSKLNQDYIFDDSQRIFNSGSFNQASELIPSEKLKQLSPGYPQVYLKEGQSYQVGFKNFLSSASGSRILANYSHGHRILVFLILPLILWGFFYWVMSKRDGLNSLTAFYLFGLLLVPFCGPMTWTQRMVWILPLLPWILGNLVRQKDETTRRNFILCLIPFILIGLPMLALKGMGFYYCVSNLWLILLFLRIQSIPFETAKI